MPPSNEFAETPDATLPVIVVARAIAPIRTLLEAVADVYVPFVSTAEPKPADAATTV